MNVYKCKVFKGYKVDIYLKQCLHWAENSDLLTHSALLVWCLGTQKYDFKYQFVMKL